jgi:ankyrin repeat protein
VNMGDALSLVANLVAVVQISGNIISLCYDYHRGVKGADKGILSILRETQTLRNAVEPLILLVNAESPGDEPYILSLKSMSLDGGPLQEIQDDLQALEERLRIPVNRWQKLGNQLLWPLRERDAKQALQTIHRVKGILEFGLLTDMSTSIVEIRKSTKDIGERLSEFQIDSTHLSEQKKLQVILNRLGAPEASSRHISLCKKRVKNTGFWLLQGAEFSSWYKSRGSSFWLHGIPGCGKSVLSSAVIEHSKLDSRDDQGRVAALAYFHFDFSDEISSTSDMMLRSLITQLVRWKGSLPHALERFAEKQFENESGKFGSAEHRDAVFQFNDSDLLDILQDIIKECSDVYIVLDALDECLDLEELLKILETIVSPESDSLHIFLASRSMAEISAALESKLTHIVKAEVKDLNEDIQSVVKSRLETHSKLRKWPVDLRVEIYNSLIKGACGMFRWADCQLEILGKCLNIRDVRKSLSSLPKTLTETYESILKGVDEHHWDYTVKILIWLALSPQPLEIKEAVDILAVDLDSKSEPVFDEDLRMPDPMEILTVCTSLVTATTKIRRQAVGELEKVTELRLAHYTVREFLLSDMFFSQFKQKVPFDSISHAYMFMAKVSLGYILSLQSPLTQELYFERPLSRHAAEFWLGYYKKSPQPPELEDLAFRLLHDNGETIFYRNWCKLFDPDMPWRQPNLKREIYPGPLYYASLEGLQSIVLALIDEKSDLNMNGGVRGSCLEAAASNGHIGTVRILLKAVIYDNKPFRDRETALTLAAKSGHTDVVKLLLAHKTNANKRPFSFCQPLFYAAARGDAKTVKELIDGGANPNYFHPKMYDGNIISLAVSHNHLDCVALMLPKATRNTALGGLRSVSKLSDTQKPAMLELFAQYVPDGVLYYAAGLGFENLTIELLDKNAKPETKICHGDEEISTGSALFEACRKGHLSIAKQLISRGADINASDGISGETYPLAAAARNGNIEIVKLLLDQGAEVNTNGAYGSALSIAAFEGRTDIVKLLLGYGADLDDSYGGYGGPVQAAVLGNHIDILKLLLTVGADVNLKAGSARNIGDGVKLSGSPLMAAVVSSDPTLVNFLLQHGADPNCQGRGFWRKPNTPLSTAANEGNLDLVNRLLIAGADVNGYNEQSRVESGSALFWAVDSGALDVVKRLLEVGADPNVLCESRDHGWITILANACMKGVPLIVNTLLEAGADIRKYSEFEEQHEPPFHTAVRSQSVEVLGLLVKHGADVNEQSEGGWTALHKAMRHRSDETLKLLIEDLHADLSVRLDNGSLPIHSAASWNNAQGLELLVQAGSDINATNNSGRTPLHWAADQTAPRAVKWLLDHGANHSIVEVETNMTARDYAEQVARENHSWKDAIRKEVLELFNRHGAKSPSSEP